MSINRVILEGNVGKDPVIKYFDKSQAIASFPLATSDSYTNQQGEVVTTTEWHNIVLRRALAQEAEKFIKKGSHLFVAGKIRTRSYVDKEGVNKYITEIIGDSMYIYDKRSDTRPSGNSYGSGNQNEDVAATNNLGNTSQNLTPEQPQSPEDDLPF